MTMDCRLFAVPEDEVEGLKAKPAPVLGRLMLGGSPMCELANANRTISLLQSGGSGATDDPGRILLTGGLDLDLPRHIAARPRLLTFQELKRLNAALQRVPAFELQRRFNHQCLVSTVLEQVAAETSQGLHAYVFAESENPFEDDWTLDQAEEFERISQQVESLKAFVAQTTGRREGLLIVMVDRDFVG